MIDRVYRNYRDGLADEREQILEYFGEGFLPLEELRVALPHRMPPVWQQRRRECKRKKPLRTPPNHSKDSVQIRSFIQITTRNSERNVSDFFIGRQLTLKHLGLAVVKIVEGVASRHFVPLRAFGWTQWFLCRLTITLSRTLDFYELPPRFWLNLEGTSFPYR